MKLSQVDLIANVIKDNFLSYIENDLPNEDKHLSPFYIWQNFKAIHFNYNSKIELGMSWHYFNLIKNHENPSFSSVVEKLPKPYAYKNNSKEIKEFLQNHQISNELLNRAIEEEYNQNGYSEDVDKLNKQIIKELIFKKPDYKILMDCLTKNNTDLDLYSELFSKLFIKDKKLQIGLTFDKENNTNLIDLLNPRKTNTINNDDITIACLHYPYLDSVDKHLQEYIGKHFLKDNDYWIKVSKLLNKDHNDVLEEIEINKYSMSLMFANLIIRNSYLLTLPHKVVPQNVNLTQELMNQNNSLYNSNNDITNTSVATIEIKPLIKFFEVKSDRNNTINNQRLSLLTIGKYYQRVLDFPADSQEIQNLTNLYKAEIGTLKLKFVPNNDVENWIQVYKSPYLSSCMSKEDTIDSIRSYAISSPYWDYHQKVKTESGIIDNKIEKRSFKDNGLVLCYCGDINSAQSRAIVNLKNKQYVSSYGDKKTIDFLLQKHGFKKNDKAFENVPIVITKTTRQIDNKSENIWFGPYVDGDTQSGNIDFEIKDNDRELMLVKLTSEKVESDLDLNSDQARVLNKWHEFRCPCCRNIYDLNQANPIFTIESDGTLYDSGTSICKSLSCENDSYYGVPVYKGYEQIWIENYHEALKDDIVIKCNDKYYINDTMTLHIHDIVHSEYQNKWLDKKASDVVYVEHINDYVEDDHVVESYYLQEKIMKKDACWSKYHESYLIESNCVYSKQFNSNIDEDIAVLVDNEYFPDDALDTDSDGYYKLNDKGQRYLGLDEDEALELMYSIQNVEIPTPDEEDEPTYSSSSRRRYR